MNEWMLCEEAFVDRFERISRLAHRLFQVPLAWVVEEQYERLTAWGSPRETGPDGPARLELSFVLNHPLSDSEGRNLGQLVLADRQPRELDADDIAVLEQLGRTVATELALTWRVHHDPLTGLYGRAGLAHMATSVLELCRRAALPLCLYCFDLDGFKTVNDRWGHAEGDLALQAFGDLLRRAFRTSDVIARPGGDEFVVLALDDVSRGPSSPALQRLTRLVGAYNAHGSKPYDLVFSAGQCRWAGPAAVGLDGLMACADRQMLDRKASKKRVLGLA